MEWYRDDLEDDRKRDPHPYFEKQLLDFGFDQKELNKLQQEAIELVESDFKRAQESRRPKTQRLNGSHFCPYANYRRKRGTKSCGQKNGHGR